MALRAGSPSLELRIGRLVFEGVDPGDRGRIGGLVQSELERLFAERGVPAGLAVGGAVGTIRGAGIMIAPGATAEHIGAQVASALYQSLGGSQA
jgi:hypothetical protein